MIFKIRLIFLINLTVWFGILSYDVASGSEITPCNKSSSGLQIFGKRYNVHDNAAYIMTKL